ncbi:hypothetical protein TESS_TESS_00359 [Tessaracoccus sp. O5.2]|uniref:hypothetical protein n=1 Tax=Tessaracoccus sp. O5.2 TaxID=3157622 RepID=UPI0035E75E07
MLRTGRDLSERTRHDTPSNSALDAAGKPRWGVGLLFVLWGAGSTPPASASRLARVLRTGRDLSERTRHDTPSNSALNAAGKPQR